MPKAKAKRRKSSVSARDRRARHAKAAREARRDAQVEREFHRRLDTLFGPETPPARAAALWLEHLDGRPVPVAVSQMLAVTASVEHAHAVAAELSRLDPAGVPGLTLSADVAFQLDGDARGASALIDRALETTGETKIRVALCAHLLELGRLAEALAIAEGRLVDFPEDADAQRLYAAALELAHARMTAAEDCPDECSCRSGRSWSDCCRRLEWEALERFADRSRLYSVRDAMRRFTASVPGVRAMIAEHVASWLQAADQFGHRKDAREGLVQAATEHAWLIEGGDEERQDDAPLALFAQSATTDPADATAARRWYEHLHYGLWQIADPTPQPGVWMTELLSSERRYVAIPPEQLEGLGRWTVLLGALVAIDGTWRTTSTLVPLRPTEADGVCELAKELIYHVASSASGTEVHPDRRARWHDEPAGVLASQTEPVSAEVASFFSKVLGSGMPQLLRLIGELRARAPKMVNTDEDPICMIKATVRVRDAHSAVERLGGHPDIRRDGDELTWWGRALDDLERATMKAEVRSLLDERGEHADAIEMDGPQRWLRGKIKPGKDALEIEVNSRERLERFLELLRDLGEEPVIADQLVIDPAQDLPQLQLGPMLSVGGSEASQAEWLAHFPDQPLPALDGRTPRESARRRKDAPRLEALLRELEHDADILAGRGMPAPDIARLRDELDAPAAAWLD